MGTTHSPALLSGEPYDSIAVPAKIFDAAIGEYVAMDKLALFSEITAEVDFLLASALGSVRFR